MRVELSSLMIVAHEIKRRNRISMGEALKLAWAKAKGFTHFALISLSDAGKFFRREIATFENADQARAYEIGFVNEIARSRQFPIHSTLNVIGSQHSRI